MRNVYLQSLVGKLFKILPLREKNNDESYRSYLDSLWIEMSGACYTFPVLWDDADYISILNIVGYLTTNEVSEVKCRREVFKAISLAKKVMERRGADE